MTHTEAGLQARELLGLDVGLKRIGVARINTVARIPEPLETLTVTNQIVADIQHIAEREGSELIVVGLPLTASGQDSEQTLHTRRFADTLYAAGLNVALQDETLTTVAANDMLKSGNVPTNRLGKVPTDDELAACMILNQYLHSSERTS